MLWVRDAYGCELLRVRDARVITLKNRRMWCEMRMGATCGVKGARCVWGASCCGCEMRGS